MLEILTKFIFLQLAANTVWRDQTFDCRSMTDNIKKLIFLYTNTKICLLTPIFLKQKWQCARLRDRELDFYRCLQFFGAFFCNWQILANYAKCWQLLNLLVNLKQLLLTVLIKNVPIRILWFFSSVRLNLLIWISSLFLNNEIFRYRYFLSIARVLDSDIKTLKTLLALEIKMSHSGSKVWDCAWPES